jgi:hypothetical protein
LVRASLHFSWRCKPLLHVCVSKLFTKTDVFWVVILCVDVTKSLRQERLFLLLFGSFDTMFNSEGGEYDSEYVYDGFYPCLFYGNDL